MFIKTILLVDYTIKLSISNRKNKETNIKLKKKEKNIYYKTYI